MKSIVDAIDGVLSLAVFLCLLPVLALYWLFGTRCGIATLILCGLYNLFTYGPAPHQHIDEPELTFLDAAVELFTPHDTFQWSAAILLIVLVGGCVVYKVVKPTAPATGGHRPKRTP